MRQPFISGSVAILLPKATTFGYYLLYRTWGKVKLIFVNFLKYGPFLIIFSGRNEGTDAVDRADDEGKLNSVAPRETSVSTSQSSENDLISNGNYTKTIFLPLAR